MTTAAQTAQRIEVGRDRAELARDWRGSRAAFWRAVISAGMDGRISNPLKPFAVAGSDENSGLIGSVGGFLVPQSVAPLFLRRPYSDPAASRTTPVPMGTPI